MTFISKEDYWKLIQSAESGDDDLDEDYHFPETSWIPADSPAKLKMEQARKAGGYGTADVLNYKREELREILYSTTNLRVGEFTVRVEEYHGRPNKNSSTDLTMDILVWQEKFQTPSGAPCKMSYKMDFFRDNRFLNRPWLSYFNSSGHAHDIPADTVIEVIKYLQVIQRLNAFM